MGKGRDEGNEIHCTDIEAIKDVTQRAVDAFARQWMPAPCIDMLCELMDQRQLRDAMGLRATIEAGDPWPKAEKLLLDKGFRWQHIGGCRVMALREREDYRVDDGWEEAEEVANN